MRIAIVGAVAAIILMNGMTAEAQQNVEAEAKAKAQFDAGVGLFEEGKYEKAAVAFARAYELRPSYKILYLVGKCENALEHFAASLDAYTRYLAEAGDKIDGARRDEVRAEIARLDALVGAVVVESDAEGAAVYIDDERRGETPLASPVFVDLGKHTVVVKQGALELHREVVKVAGGQRVAVKVAAAAGDGAAAAAAAPEPVAKTAPAREEGSLPETAEKPKRVWTWVAVGIGGAAAIGAAITGGLAISKTNDLEDDCRNGSCDPSLSGERDTSVALGYTADALIAVAGVGIAAGVVLFFVEPKLRERERAIEVAPVAAPTAKGGAFALVGRF